MAVKEIAITAKELRPGDVVKAIHDKTIYVDRVWEPRPLPQPVGSVIGYRTNIDHGKRGLTYLQNFLVVVERVDGDTWIDGESGLHTDDSLISSIRTESLTGDWFPITLNEDI